MISVYYDGKCGLCRREIDHYKRIAPSDVFQWVDVTEDASALSRLGISYSESLRSLHAEDEHGALHQGVDSFLLIWKQLRGWKYLALLVSLPGIYHIACLSYRKFADWRFARLAHCQLAQQQEQKQQHDL